MPRRAPASLQLWHGGPPMMPSQSGTSLDGMSMMLRWSSVVRGKFALIVWAIDLSYSLAHATRKPAFLKPRSKPPAPEKSETIVGCARFFAILQPILFPANCTTGRWGLMAQSLRATLFNGGVLNAASEKWVIVS